MMMVALVLHLWHMVAPGGKLGVSSSASGGEGIAAEAAPTEAEAEALDPGVRRDDEAEAESLGPGFRRDDGSAVDAAAAASVTSNFFFDLAS